MSVRRQKTAVQGTRWDYFALVIVKTPGAVCHVEECALNCTVIQLYKDALQFFCIFQTKLSPNELQEITLEKNRIKLI